MTASVHPQPAPQRGAANEERLWRAVMDHESRTDFVYAVRTTGVYCRPDCSARRPRRANVAFFPTPAAAERAGFRPCRRCTPEALHPQLRRRALVARACRDIEAADPPPALAALARAAGLSSWHFQRLFKAELGISPREYAQTLRLDRLRAGLAGGRNVTQAMHEAGFGSASRAYAHSAAALGMAPAAYRAGGRGAQIRHAVVTSTLGWLLVAATARGLCAVEFGAAPDELRARLRARFPRAVHLPPDAAFEALVRRVVAAVDDPRATPDLPLDIRGTAFQRRVWDALRALPPGVVVSYAELARRIGAPRAARAVGSACAANPLAVLVPCHRVRREDGALGGYRWGTQLKQRLLAREAAGAPKPARRRKT